MSLSPEFLAEYEEASKPFVVGAINEQHSKMHSWRIFLEINSKCQLRCPTCTKGNMDGYDHQTGFMDPGLMERILDKIKSENPKARIMLYGNSEPMLHPKLAECIASVKKRGLECEFSTNLNHVNRLDDVLAAQPDFIIISLSGFTQEIYERGHAGGNIEKVKKNMVVLSEANARANPKIHIAVNFHQYTDNDHELPLMKEYATGLGFGFFTSFARAISMENSIQYCRHHDPEATPFEVQEGRPDWNQALPPIGETYKNVMDRVKIKPTAAREMYKHIPVANVCPVGAGGMFTFIRHDGKTEMCACVADRRITVGDYMDTTPEQMIEQRTGHSICKQCIKYRLNLMFHIVPGHDGTQWT